MRFNLRLFVVCSLIALLVSTHAALSQNAEVDFAKRETAYVENNKGVALLEQFNYKDAAAGFRRALQIDDKLAVARINLSIALYNIPETESAEREALQAVNLAPRIAQPHYILGLIAKANNRTDEAIASFKRVLEIDNTDVGANIQLGQLYAQSRNYAEAVKSFQRALDSEPYNTTALYNLANALSRSGNREEGTKLLVKFQELRASGAGTSIGQNYLEQGRYAEAITSTGAESNLVDRTAPRVTFGDASSNALPPDALRPANVAASVEKDAKHNDVMNANIGREFATANAGGVTMFDMDADGDLDALSIAADSVRLYRNDAGKYVDATNASGLNEAANNQAASNQANINFSGNNAINIAAVAGDYDNDGRPDLFILRFDASGKSAAGALYKNEGAGIFSNQTANAALAAYPFLASSAAFVDVDHDGDLDIFIGGYADFNKTKTTDAKALLANRALLHGAPNQLLRNNGDGKFVDATRDAKLEASDVINNRVVAVVPTDYDNRRDVDLLTVRFAASPVLYRNLRDRTFRDVTAEVGLTMTADNKITCAAVGDLNKDGFSDFFFGRIEAAQVLALSDGRGAFKLQNLSEPVRANVERAKSASGAPLVEIAAAQIFDYDNDGLLDIIAVSDRGLRAWRNLGTEFQDVSERLLPANAAPPSRGGWYPRSFASGDTDADGDTDLLLRLSDGSLRIARNDGGNSNNSLRLNLAGRVSNRSAIAAKIEMRAGSLWQKLETYSATPAPAPADVGFGLGKRGTADAVRVIWTSGIVQAEMLNADEGQADDLSNASATSNRASDKSSNANSSNTGSANNSLSTNTSTANSSANNSLSTTSSNGNSLANSSSKLGAPRVLNIIELDRKPSSCPFLYTWNGERFEFITDMMGGGEMGAWISPNAWNTPDPDEYVRITNDKLKIKDGRFELRVTNELEEAVFFDRMKLLVINHPSNLEVHPNEGLGNPTASNFITYKAANVRLPVSATDDKGRDVIDDLRAVDRRFVEGFGLHKIRGYAEPHSLVLDLGATTDKPLLLLTAWTDYAFSSDNVAAYQQNLKAQMPALQVKNQQGEWQTVIENIGLPVGRPQTVAVDLSSKFLTANRQVRIVTNLRIYWDAARVADNTSVDINTVSLEPVIADLHSRGYSLELKPDGREPLIYDYNTVKPDGGWKLIPGTYTREGDVRELLLQTDDIFAISRPGDEVSLSFDAANLTPLPDGWTRTYFFYIDGFSKEMDINSATPDAVAPLPFHGMKRYPYDASERYPNTPRHREYLEKYNTRIINVPLRELK